MRRCFSSGCKFPPEWEFEYEFLTLLACPFHMTIAEKTSRQVKQSRVELWTRNKKPAKVS